jgi:hypothetical protein
VSLADRPKTAAEFRVFFRIGVTKFYGLVNQGQLRISKIGRSTIVLPDDEAAFVASLGHDLGKSPRVAGGAR